MKTREEKNYEASMKYLKLSAIDERIHRRFVSVKTQRACSAANAWVLAAPGRIAWVVSDRIWNELKDK